VIGSVNSRHGGDVAGWMDESGFGFPRYSCTWKLEQKTTRSEESAFNPPASALQQSRYPGEARGSPRDLALAFSLQSQHMLLILGSPSSTAMIQRWQAAQMQVLPLYQGTPFPEKTDVGHSGSGTRTDVLLLRRQRETFEFRTVGGCIFSTFLEAGLGVWGTRALVITSSHQMSRHAFCALSTRYYSTFSLLERIRGICR
jgi:hypothetical protein